MHNQSSFTSSGATLLPPTHLQVSSAGVQGAKAQIPQSSAGTPSPIHHPHQGGDTGKLWWEPRTSPHYLSHWFSHYHTHKMWEGTILIMNKI